MCRELHARKFFLLDPNKKNCAVKSESIIYLLISWRNEQTTIRKESRQREKERFSLADLVAALNIGGVW